MNKKLFLIMLMLSFSSVVYADFDKGVAAYEKGNYEVAFKEFSQAAEQGFARAQYNLGVMYANGEGVRQNKKTAKEWYGKACDNGNQGGCKNYRILNKAGI